MERVILKISGEALKGKRESGIDPDKMISFAKEIKNAFDLNLVSIGIVTGGGNFYRGRDALALGISRIDCDYLGMLGTIMNSLALKNALQSLGVPVALFTSLEVPEVVDLYNKDDANKALDEGKVAIFAGGTGRPYFSTDTAALLKAIDVKAKTILMGKNGTDGVYDSDPNLNKSAKKYDILTHRDILDKKLAVMDQSAAAIADDNNINILVFNIEGKDAIVRAVKGEKIGTIIKKEA